MCFSHVEGMEKVIRYYPFLPQRQLGGQVESLLACVSDSRLTPG